MTPVAGRPLTAEDCKLLQRGDVVAFGQLVGSLKGVADGWGCATLIAPNGAEFSRILHRGFTFIGRPDADGWMPWSGGENPVPGCKVNLRWLGTQSDDSAVWDANAQEWEKQGAAFDIIAFRLSRPASDQSDEDGPEKALEDAVLYGIGFIVDGKRVSPDRVTVCGGDRPSDQPVEAIGAGREEIARVIRDRAQIGGTDWRRNAHGADINAEELADLIAALSPASPARTPMGDTWPEVTDAWAETYCELTGRDPDGQQVTFVDGGTVTTFRDIAKREIEAMLCAAPKPAVRAIAEAAPTPMGGEVEALREALREIAALPNLSRDPADDYCRGVRAARHEARQIAECALAAASPSPAQGGEFDTLEEWEHDDQRELSRLYRHRFDDSLQFNRSQMRTAIRHGRRLQALSASPQPEAGEASEDDRAQAWLLRHYRQKAEQAGFGSLAEMMHAAAPPSVQPVEGK